MLLFSQNYNASPSAHRYWNKEYVSLVCIALPSPHLCQSDDRFADQWSSRHTNPLSWVPNQGDSVWPPLPLRGEMWWASPVGVNDEASRELQARLGDLR